MAWSNGTMAVSERNLSNQYPIKVTDDLWFSRDMRRLVLINSFDKNSALYTLSDPHAERNDRGEHVFHHVFLEKDAKSAREYLQTFLSIFDPKDCKSVALLRREDGRLFQFANGHISLSRVKNQRALQSLLPDSLPQKAKAFVLPLKRFMHKCPVCGIRTLTHRGLFEICPECGWEDAGVDGEDEESFFCVNGDYTIRRYRNWYLKKKAADPSFASESAGFPTPMDEEEP